MQQVAVFLAGFDLVTTFGLLRFLCAPSTCCNDLQPIFSPHMICYHVSLPRFTRSWICDTDF